MRLLLTYLLIQLVVLTGASQGWERIVSGAALDAALAVAPTQDGGYILTGYELPSRINLIKVDPDGRPLWSSKITGGSTVGSGHEVLVLADGTYVVAGELRAGAGQPAQGFLAHTDAFGKLIWSRTFGSAQGDDRFNDVVQLPNGNLLVLGTYEETNNKDNVWLLETSLSGTLVKEQRFGLWDLDEKGNALTLAANGDILIAGDVKELIDVDVLIMRVAQSGTLVWSQTYGFDFVITSPSSDRALDVVLANDGSITVCGVTNAASTGGGGLLLNVQPNGNPTPNWFSILPSTPLNSVVSSPRGGYTATGLKEVSSASEDVHIVRVDAQGSTIWTRTVGKGGTDVGHAIMNTNDGGVLIAGVSSPSLIASDSYAYLVKTDSLGRVHTNLIEGVVFQDLNSNCTQGSAEPFLKDWIVKIVSTDQTRYTVTDGFGRFQVTVDTGKHIVSVLPANELWEPCQDEYPVTFSVQLDSERVVIPVRPSIICPNNVVDTQGATLRQCAENQYFIRYCNQGTFPSPNTRVEVILDPALTYVSASAPATVRGDTVSFNLGYLEKGQCGDIRLTAFLRCDSVLLGQAHCVTAHIYPDTICIPSTNWDGSIIRAFALCDNQTVKLGLKNVGANATSKAIDFIVIEDLVDGLHVPVILDAGQDSVIITKPADGKTYRVIATQSPGYPGGGYPTAAIEGCKTDTTSSISLGYYTMFPEDDAEPFISTNCLESISSGQQVQAFMKSGHPKGYDTDRYISPENTLTYVIQFANLGTDTIKTVTIRDTLSAALDAGTVYPGASSHPYQFSVYGGGIVQFNLPNADLLPGGSATQTRAQGFVSFRVAQKPNLSCETKIVNSAAVYFNYKPPVITNQVIHTVCARDSFITVHTNHTLFPRAEVKVYPNPFTDLVTIELQEVQGKQFNLHIFDIAGKLLHTETQDHPIFRLTRSQIPAGMHTYRLVADGKPVTVGKIVKMQ